MKEILEFQKRKLPRKLKKKLKKHLGKKFTYVGGLDDYKVVGNQNSYGATYMIKKRDLEKSCLTTSSKEKWGAKKAK